MCSGFFRGTGKLFMFHSANRRSVGRGSNDNFRVNVHLCRDGADIRYASTGLPNGYVQCDWRNGNGL